MNAEYNNEQNLELLQFFDQISDLKKEDIVMLKRIVLDYLATFKNINVTKSSNALNIHNTEKAKTADYEYYINLIKDNSTWQLQLGNALVYTQNTIKHIDNHESVYYVVDGLLAVDIIERKIVEHLGEQKVNMTTNTYYFKQKYWEPQLEHTKIYFEDLVTHQVMVVDSETRRLQPNNIEIGIPPLNRKKVRSH